jgi:hypothetical protein
VSARRQSSGVGAALLGVGAAATIIAFAFMVLPKFLVADRHSVPPITVDLFVSPEHKLAATQGPAMTGRLAGTAKRHGLAALGSTNQPKLGVGTEGGGVRTSAADGRT